MTPREEVEAALAEVEDAWECCDCSPDSDRLRALIDLGVRLGLEASKFSARRISEAKPHAELHCNTTKERSAFDCGYLSACRRTADTLDALTPAAVLETDAPYGTCRCGEEMDRNGCPFGH